MLTLQSLALSGDGCLTKRGLEVLLALDSYPEGHQGGVTIIQNGRRVASNGDLRLDRSPGQWSPIPRVGSRQRDPDTRRVSVEMSFPDPKRNRVGFNPIEYPDLEFGYELSVRAEQGGFVMRAELTSPLPEEWVPKVGLSLEFFPGHLIGKSYVGYGGGGVFAPQPIGPVDRVLEGGQWIAIAPESDASRMEIRAVEGTELSLIDGRAKHNNGWFIVRSGFVSGQVGSAIEWEIDAHAIPGWTREPVIQVSQVGYHPRQPKVAVIELDVNDTDIHDVELLQIFSQGPSVVRKIKPTVWGNFLRYRYLTADFSEYWVESVYMLRYGTTLSAPFRISRDIYEDGLWQPTVDTFLPVQMCHMRVNENYRCWHGACHLDDARMAPVDFNHIDGYRQGHSTLTRFEPEEHVGGLDHGGWHDAGDYDLRVESQAATIHGLALAYEEFGLTYDNVTVDQERRVVELMRPDGIPDILQQVQHGALWIVQAFDALGRLPRGVIERDVRQYTHLGDAATVTDNTMSDDDRWVFTEDNPDRECEVAAALAASARVLKEIDPELASRSIEIAASLVTDRATDLALLPASLELFLTTGDTKWHEIVEMIGRRLPCTDGKGAGTVARALPYLDFVHYAKAQLMIYSEQVNKEVKKTPYGIPYNPAIWGAGWQVQRFGVEHYWMHKALPLFCRPDDIFSALNFVLGVHPGENTSSFVSGVGTRSMIPGYGVNRADNSYIPGGIGSGTALIRPDLPELLEWPYLWQQTEYCVGWPTSDFVFLAAAAAHLLKI